MPTCFGEARKVVLNHLGNRYGRALANPDDRERVSRSEA